MIKGKYHKRKNCRLCSSKRLVLFLNLGEMPLAGDFLLKNQVGKEAYYPLELYRCLDCSLVQVTHIISANTLFEDYRYISSVGLSDHFRDYAKQVVKKFNLKNKQILEIGSNDGVLLAPLSQLGVRVLGIDPAKNIAAIANAKGLPTIPDFFTENTAGQLVKQYGKFHAIFANNVLAHIDTIEDVFKGIALALSDEGVLVFEVHYLPSLLKKLQYDFFYNEHMNYYTLTSLKAFLQKFSLEIFSVKKIPIHSGSIRVYVKNKKNVRFPITESVNKLQLEENIFFANDTIYITFVNKVERQKIQLTNFLRSLKSKGKKIIGYGASGRGNTLLNFCKIDTSILSYIVDDSPERYNRYTPGTHIPIVSRLTFQKDNPDYVLLLAWNYKKMIVAKEKEFIKRGGKFILPLPSVTIFAQS